MIRLPGENFSLDQFDRPFTNVVFANISFTMNDDPSETLRMYHQQVYQLRAPQFSMQVHLLNLFTKKSQTPCKAFNYFINVLKK